MYTTTVKSSETYDIHLGLMSFTFFAQTLKAIGLIRSYYLSREGIYGAAGGVRSKVEGGEGIRRHRPNRDSVH